MKTWAIGLLLSCTALNVVAADTHTITGIVSDTMCGARHPKADVAACMKDCLKKGADYALVVNGDVYSVKADNAQQEKLAKRVGKPVVVLGDFQGMTITATKVSTPKKISKH